MLAGGGKNKDTLTEALTHLTLCCTRFSYHWSVSYHMSVVSFRVETLRGRNMENNLE